MTERESKRESGETKLSAQENVATEENLNVLILKGVFKFKNQSMCIIVTFI